MLKELHKETAPDHALRRNPLVAVARRDDCDDVLFQARSGPFAYAIVHLSWTEEPEFLEIWPGWSPLADDEALLEAMERDSRERTR